MAARWRGKDADLNADRGDFLTNNTADKLVLGRGDADVVEMDSQSCTDHSILSLFDIHTVASEGKGGVEEESESLLSALTEMLDSVEDDDRTLSPFDVLPDTKLLTRPRCRDPSVVFSLSGRSPPKPRSPTVTLTVNRDGDKESEDNIPNNCLPQLFTKQSQTPLKSKAKKAEKEVEVFTSSSLVNLVRLMHPYCLKLHVEEGRSQRKKPAVFSQEEVLRYERPNDESDEEINVVSDDEEPAKEPTGVEKRDEGKLRKSVLLNGNSPRAREKKRVSFGPVQVASFTDSVEKRLNEKNHTSDSVLVSLHGPKAGGHPAGSEREPQTAMFSELICKKVDDMTTKCETKAKSLSLQQYRQLRQRRQPLVEKQGNNTTKWPSVSEPPMELPPILCLEAQTQNSCGPKTAHNCTSLSPDHLHKHEFKTSHHVYPPLTKPSTHLRRGELKRQRPESRSISPASPLPGATTGPNGKASKRIRSSAKKPTPLSSDPPNPVLVPLLACHTESKAAVSSHQGSTPLEETQGESSATCLQREPFPSEVLSINQEDNPLQESKNTFTEIVSDDSSRSPASCPTTTQSEPASGKTELDPKASAPPSGADPERQRKHLSSTPSPADASLSVKEALSPAALQVGCTEQKVTSESGIEAPDLTSLLEQFEETQAKEERVCENQPGLNSPTLTPSLQTRGHMELDRNQPVGSEKTSRLLLTASVEPPEHLSTSESPGKTFRNLVDVGVDIPEPLGTDIVLSTRQEQPARRRNPPSKAIQIIDPRPLPPRRTHISTSEPLAPHTSLHLYLSVSSDHDYCGTMDHSVTCATQRSRNKPSMFKEKMTDEVQVTSLSSAAAAERKTQIGTGQTKSVSQCHSEIASETNPATDEALQLSHCSAATGDVGASEDKRAPYTLPTPPPSPPDRGREKMRYRRRSPRSDSSSSCSSSSSSSSPSSSRSAPRSPKRRRRSDSSSSSASPCRSASHSPPRRFRLSYSRSRCSRSRSRSWSRSRSPSKSRSPSPLVRRQQWKGVYRSREARKLRREHEMRIQKLKAIDERRVVYVGRIRRSMTHDELRERFSQFGEVECVSLHFRDRGDHYGFVTFYNTEDAFAAIDNGGKLRKPNELPFDLCFGGRRQFCNSNYADLDANRDTELSPVRNSFEDQDFDALLKQAQRGLKR